MRNLKNFKRRNFRKKQIQINDINIKRKRENDIVTSHKVSREERYKKRNERGDDTEIQSKKIGKLGGDLIKRNSKSDKNTSDIDNSNQNKNSLTIGFSYKKDD